jgi:hypothetical protein
MEYQDDVSGKEFSDGGKLFRLRTHPKTTIARTNSDMCSACRHDLIQLHRPREGAPHEHELIWIEQSWRAARMQTVHPAHLLTLLGHRGKD